MVTPTFADSVELLFTLFERFWQQEAARSQRGRRQGASGARSIPG